MIQRPLRIAAVGAAVLGLAATAHAVTPKSALYTVPGWGEGTGYLKVANGKIQRHSTAPSHFGCRMDTRVTPSIPISNGAFRYSGKPTNGPGHIVLEGHWVSATKIKGTTTLSKGSCKKTVRWTAVPFVAPTYTPPPSDTPPPGYTPPADTGPAPSTGDDTTPPTSDLY